MKVSTAVLCDFASVREGLLFVVGGGVTRLWREELPSPLNMHLALIAELHPHEAETPHQLEVIVSNTDGQQLMKIDGAFQVAGASVQIGERHQIPMALPLMGEITNYGPYGVDIFIDNLHQADLQFHVEERPQPINFPMGGEP